MHRSRMDEKHIEYKGSYKGLLASSWNIIRGDSSDWEDTKFYRRVIRDNGQPALDVGCGTGRILLQFLEEGLDVEGLDNAPELLEICERNATERGLKPTLHLQPMEALSIDRKFRTIFVASAALVYVPTQEVIPTLKGFFDHLDPGGKVVFSSFGRLSDFKPIDARLGKWHLDCEGVRPEDGATVRWWTKGIVDTGAREIHLKNRVEVVVEGRVVEREYSEESLYILTRCGYEQALKSAGFVDISASGKRFVMWVGTRT